MGALRRVCAVALGGLMVSAGWVAPASAGTPATVTTSILSYDPGSFFIPCGTTTLQFVSGTSRSVYREGQSASGNLQYTMKNTINGVVIDGDGNLYNIHGVQAQPTVIRVQDGVETQQTTQIEKFVLLDPSGGLVDKFNSTITFSLTIVDGELIENRFHFVDQGTCPR
jgi:hypothetical protein